MNYKENVSMCIWSHSSQHTKSGRRPSLSTTLVATIAEIHPLVPHILDVKR